MEIKRNLILFCLTVLLLAVKTNGQNSSFLLSFSSQDLTVLVDETEEVVLELNGYLKDNASLWLIKQHDDLVELNPNVINLKPSTDQNSKDSYRVQVIGLNPGHLEVTSNLTINDEEWPTNNLFLRITVAISMPIIYISIVIGWIYFAAWSVSFYPQIYYNYQRKSVVGLNFDFLALNIVGFVLYGVFNMGLFWNSTIEDEYYSRFPRGLNPVLINDVVFALHASLATLFTIGQCFIYERGEQRVSNVARAIIGVFIIIVIVCAILAGTEVFHWLDFLYICSYIKLTITLIKYIPQAVMNYRRKSTIGWSIGNILLDFTGGILSMLQMILNAYNFDDWESIFGDPTKFGLGLFSVCFDIFFMVQHYILYRNLSPYETINGEDDINPRRPHVITDDADIAVPTNGSRSHQVDKKQAFSKSVTANDKKKLLSSSSGLTSDLTSSDFTVSPNYPESTSKASTTTTYGSSSSLDKTTIEREFNAPQNC